ncbi:MAG: cyclic-di-AMP receptor, partial [Clostridia bacterium]|nr:cyclic-di-AMP receptor [Clostridia bacterium]
MKLIVAIINNDDSASVLNGLTQKGYSATKLSTSGGFLRAGNSTLIIGT